MVACLNIQQAKEDAEIYLQFGVKIIEMELTKRK